MFVKNLVKGIRFINEWHMGCVVDDNFLICAAVGLVFVQNGAGLCQHGLGWVHVCAGPAGNDSHCAERTHVGGAIIGDGYVIAAPHPEDGSFRGSGLF